MSKDKEVAEDEFCRILMKINALEFGTFKLSSGRVTPYYLDLRLIPSFPDAFHRIIEFCATFVKHELHTQSFDKIAGIPIAGIPLASILAFQLDKPFLYVRQGVRLHGRKRRVEGVLISGDRVLLVDDLITTGLSLKRTATAIRSEGGIVEDAFVLLDREEGGAKRLAETDVKVHSLFKISGVAEELNELNAITEDQLRTILKQVKKQK